MTREQKTAILVGTCTAFITSFFGSALNLAIPSMSGYFHMGAASVGWITTAYMMIIASFSVPFGKLADSTNRRTILILGTALFGAASFLSVFMIHAAQIIGIRILQGMGAAMIFATNMPIAMSSFPGKERGKVIGIVTSGTYCGLALGPVLGGVLNSNFGWKSIFIFGGVVSLAALTVTLFQLKKVENGAPGGRTDMAGNVLYILMILSVIYGLTSLNSYRFGWAFLVLGVLIGFVFARRELAFENPVIDVRIFGLDRVFTLSNLTALLNYSATFGLGYLLSIYLQVAAGFSSQAAGIIMIAQPLFMMLLSPKMGKLSDTIAPYKLATGGMILCTVSLLFFALIRIETPIWQIMAALAVAGIGIAMFSSPNTNIIMSRVHPSKFGVTNSIVSTMRTTGQSTGMALITLVVSGTIGNVSLYSVSADDLIRVMHRGFLIFTILCAAGALMSLQRKNNKKPV